MFGHLQTLVSGAPGQKREAVEALVVDQQNRDEILNRLADMISEHARIVHRDAPDGLREGEPRKYAEIIAAATVQQAAIQTVLGILGPDGLLDDDRFVRRIDSTGMLDRLGRWPEHLICMREAATEAAEDFLQRHPSVSIHKVKIFGLGGSGAPHDIAAEIIGNWRKSSTEIEVVHADRPNSDYVDEQTLAILCSFSGNTEETLHCYERIKRKTPLLAVIARGGRLGEIAGPARDNLPLMRIPSDEKHPAYVIQPRESVCLQMTATLVFLASIGLAPGSGGSLAMADLELPEMASLLKNWRGRFGPETPWRRNPAKQLAFYLLYGINSRDLGPPGSYDLWNKRIPFVLVDRNHRAVGHEARTQMHERSKLNAAYYEAPEFLHNLVESIRGGVESSRAGLDHDRWVYYFIRSPDEESRIRLRLDKTIELVMRGKAKYAAVNVEGETPYQRAMFSTCFNAHMTTYLALLHGFDPLPVPTMSWIKNVMDGFPRDGQEERAAQARDRGLLELS